jgi:hypothetical protein
MYDFVQTDKGWMLFWGPPPQVEMVEAVAITIVDEQSDWTMSPQPVVREDATVWLTPMAS